MSKKNGNGNGVKITLAVLKERLDNLITRLDEDKITRDAWRTEILGVFKTHCEENEKKFDDINADRWRFWGAIVLGGFLVTAVLGWMAIK